MRFIRNYSSLGSPLTALIASSVRFFWSEAAENAFQQLRRRVTFVSIITIPDPSRQFIVEVDASNVGIGAVISKRFTEDNKLLPCAFFPPIVSLPQTTKLCRR